MDSSTIIFYVAIVIFCSLACGRLAKLFKFPNVTGYLIAGLILGPSLLNIIPENAVSSFSVVSDMALGFIAFSIGSEFKISYFKQVGSKPIVIAIMESMGAVILVTAVLILFRVDIYLSILLGAIAAATAPAQTIMVINQYKAKGPLTSMLMSVVALDDAVALIAFGFASTLVKAMSAHAAISVASILQPFYEIFASLLLGGALAMAMVLVLRWFKKPANRLCVLIAFIFIATFLAGVIHASTLLCCMALGAVLTNVSNEMPALAKISDSFTPPLFMIFFAMSGAGFDIHALAGIGLIGVIYVIMRVVGKMLGSYWGGKITKSEKSICRYLGPTLMPQAGVALGLILVAEAIVPQFAKQIRVVILCSTFIYSIIGPIAAKLALVKAGEIILPEKKKAA